MSKKDLKLIVVILCVAAVLFIGFQFFKNTNATNAKVVFNDKTILTFNIDKDAEYWVEGSYGKLKIEVKDHKWRVTEEDCPNHLCSKVGWVSIESYLPIVCLPNNVYVVLDED